MKLFFPATGSEAEWNSAFYRLEDYFRALRLVNKVHQSQVILRLLESAAVRHARDPSQNPTALAMGEVRAMMDRWFAGIFGQRERLNVVGLISLLAVDAPERWSLAFPCDEIPVELRQALQESEVRAGPDLLMSSMTPRPIDVAALLEPIQLPDTLGKAGRALAILVLISLVCVFTYIFLLAK
jgi:hypothetical protein